MLHYLHGVNPQGMVYLSKMYNLGGDQCANEIYHYWFQDGSIYDIALTSEVGPPPGYLVGGANQAFFTGGLSPPAGQPPQKSYLDFNTGFPDNSCEITEPAIYYQAAYVRLVANFATAQGEHCSAMGTSCLHGLQDGNCTCIVDKEMCPREGTTCDDGNPNTSNDVEDGACICSGTIVKTTCGNLIATVMDPLK